MPTIREMRIQARKLGINGAREMDMDELKDAIAEAKNGGSRRGTARKAVKKAVGARRGPGRPRKVVAGDEDDDYEEEAPRRRGRPKGSTNKAKAAPARRGRPPKATATPRRSSKSNPVGRPPGSGSGTRVLVPERIKWNKSFSFREGSTAQYILDELKKAAQKYDDTEDIREAVIDKLEPKIGKVDELIFMDRSTGRAKKGDAGYNMLRYRVNRTILDYCIETEQHDGSTQSSRSTATKSNKTATPVKRGRGRPRKVVEEDYDDDSYEDEEDEPVKPRRGRPPGRRSGASTKTAPRRGRPPKATAEAPKRRGRPPGSKNKTTAARRGPGRPKGSKNRR